MLNISPTEAEDAGQVQMFLSDLGGNFINVT